MATRVDVGNDLIDVFSGGVPDQDTTSWLQQRSQQLMGQISGAGRAFIESSRSLYQMVNETQAAQMLRNLGTKHQDAWRQSTIARLESIEAVQTANPVMQRWIMANPNVRKRYLNQELEGYAESYVNHHGDTVGQEHYDYRRVMTGIMERPREDEDWKVRIFCDPSARDDQQLTIWQRKDILNTWAFIDTLLEEAEEDPTSEYGAPM